MQILSEKFKDRCPHVNVILGSSEAAYQAFRRFLSECPTMGLVLIWMRTPQDYPISGVPVPSDLTKYLFGSLKSAVENGVHCIVGTSTFRYEAMSGEELISEILKVYPPYSEEEDPAMPEVFPDPAVKHPLEDLKESGHHKFISDDLGRIDRGSLLPPIHLMSRVVIPPSLGVDLVSKAIMESKRKLLHSLEKEDRFWEVNVDRSPEGTVTVTTKLWVTEKH